MVLLQQELKLGANILLSVIKALPKTPNVGLMYILGACSYPDMQYLLFYVYIPKRAVKIFDINNNSSIPGANELLTLAKQKLTRIVHCVTEEPKPSVFTRIHR